MTIKEVEELTGMTRANIRFYEAEGLITPRRNANGYREYSGQDMEVLKKIKLLRTLHISLEEIKALHTGECELLEALNRHIRRLEEEKADIEESQRICNQMRSDGVRYETLNAQYYLDRIGRIVEGPAPELEEDTVPRVQAPWRRFFARMFDLTLYSCIWQLILEYGVNVNISNRGTWGSLFDDIIALVIMFLLEPVLLRFLGTTPGKWLLGMGIRDQEEGRLKIADARVRTWNVMWSGMGLNIPIYNWYRNWKSYQTCTDGRMLDWEENSVITLKDEKRWRIAVFTVAYIMVPLLFSFTTVMAGMPRNRGDLTVAEFTENYNRLAEYYNLDGSSIENGKFRSESHGQASSLGGITIAIDGYVPEPELTIREEAGRITEVRFTSSMQNDSAWPRDYREKMMLCVMAFVRAREEVPLFSNRIEEMLNYIQEHPFEDFTLSEYGVTVTCEVAYSGYREMLGSTLGRMIPEADADGNYKNVFDFAFTMKLEE